MWWPKPQWYEAHIVAGATETGTRWALADGQVGSEPGLSRPVDTYILIANTSATAGSATVTLFLEGGGPLEFQMPLPANSRVNFPTTDYCSAWRHVALRRARRKQRRADRRRTRDVHDRERHHLDGRHRIARHAAAVRRYAGAVEISMQRRKPLHYFRSEDSSLPIALHYSSSLFASLKTRSFFLC